MIHWTKDGKGHEMILTPDGRRYDEHGAMDGNKSKAEDEDEDEDADEGEDNGGEDD